MTPSTAQSTHLVTAGATIGMGGVEWLTMNSTFVTAICVIITTIATMAFGFWNAKSNSDRNKVNKRDISISLLIELKSSGKDSFTMAEIEEELIK